MGKKRNVGRIKISHGIILIIIAIIAIFVIGTFSKNREGKIAAQQQAFVIEEFIPGQAVAVRLKERDFQNPAFHLHDPSEALILGTAEAAKKYNIDIGRGIPIVAKYGDGSKTSAIIYPISQKKD